MKILVIGGTRFIGAAAVRRLHELGHQVAVYNRGLAPVEPPEGVVRIRGDRDALVAARPQIEAFGPEVVLHNVVLREEQVAGALEAIRGIVQRFVMVSSCDVYRAYGRLTGTEPGASDPMPLVETSPLRESRYPYRDRFPDPSQPLHWYDKIPAEARALSDPEVTGVVLRLPMVLGPNDYQHRLFPFFRPMEDGRPALVYEESYAAWRSTYGFVENVAEAMALACTHPRARGLYNVGDASPSIAELARDVAAILNWKGEILTANVEDLPKELHPDMDTRQQLICSSEKLRDELGYSPRFSDEETLRLTLEWERRNPPDPIPPGTLQYEAEDAYLATRR
jgi:nucleoside-diphosphate-sugar epimerase